MEELLKIANLFSVRYANRTVQKPYHTIEYPNVLNYFN